MDAKEKRTLPPPSLAAKELLQRDKRDARQPYTNSVINRPEKAKAALGFYGGTERQYVLWARASLGAACRAGVRANLAVSIDEVCLFCQCLGTLGSFDAPLRLWKAKGKGGVVSSRQDPLPSQGTQPSSPAQPGPGNSHRPWACGQRGSLIA